MRTTLSYELILVVDREGRSVEDDRQSVVELVAPTHRMWFLRHLQEAFQGNATACFLQPIAAPRQMMLRWSMRPIEDEGEIVSVEVSCHRWRPEFGREFRPEPFGSRGRRCPHCARLWSERSDCLESVCEDPRNQETAGEEKLQPAALVSSRDTSECGSRRPA
jgi:hypothetical protein